MPVYQVTPLNRHERTFSPSTRFYGGIQFVKGEVSLSDLIDLLDRLHVSLFEGVDETGQPQLRILYESADNTKVKIRVHGEDLQLTLDTLEPYYKFNFTPDFYFMALDI